MKSIFYSEWDGTQLPFTLKRQEIVDRFMENIMKGMGPNMSLAEMMWEGFDMSGMDFRVMGLEEMLQELQKMKEDLFGKYNLESAFDRPIDEIKDLLDRESMTRTQRGQEQSPSYEELPPGLLEKLREFRNFQFQNKESKEAFDYWQDRQDDIRDLFDFYSKYALQFNGDESLDFDQAVELMRHFNALDNLQQQIMNGEFNQISAEDLQRFLGQQAADSMNILLQLPQILNEEGITRVEQGRLEMTPRGMRSLGELAFGKFYEQFKRDKQGGHRGNAIQTGEIEPDSSRPYRFGDRFDLDITKTILKAVSQTGGLEKLSLSPDDFYVREREPLITSTTVVLLDLSWSMSWEGRFEAAKKVALALDHYVRTRFPKDKLFTIGFSTEARELKGKDLALSVWDAYNPYTNLQGGLRLAMQLIKRSGNRNNRVIVITDGQPTAYYRGSHLHVELPNRTLGISPNACKATIGEVRKVTAQGMKIETFMLSDDPPLVEFTREISKINGGRAVICVPDDLGQLVLVEEIKRRGGRI